MAMAAAHRGADGEAGGAGRSLLLLLVLGYYWISLQPFPDLGLASLADPWVGNSNLVNQAVAIALFAALAVFALRHPLRGAIAQPRGLLIAIFAWFAITSLLAADPASALRRLVMAAMLCTSASIFLLLPRNERHFARLLGGALLFMLALAYWGIVFLPDRSIHLASDVLEPLLAGNWRGFYSHKNIAAPAMAFTVFGGMFVWARWSKPVGAILIVGALYFLFNTGGKTSLAMVPTMLVIAWAFEKFRALRYPLVVGGLAVFNLVAVGSAVWPQVNSFVDGLGIDASFTDRVDIWQLGMSAVAKHPFTGYGFQSYWQTGSLVYGGGSVETWAVNAANGHNAYIDAAINAGVPGLILVVIWLVIRPIGDFARAQGGDNDPALTRLFLRIWLYGVFSSSLESFFFANSGPVWFTILLGVFGLRFQGRAALVPAAAPEPQGEVAHA